MALTIKVLLENRLADGAENSLVTKAGLSLLIQDEATSILFDTGPDGTFLHNAERMGVDLTRLTATVLSHGHYDHCGGVPWLPDNSRIICHPQIASERYAAVQFAGFTRKLKKLSLDIDYSRHQMEYTRSPVEISEHFLWSGEIKVDEPRAYGIINGNDSAVDYVIDEGVLIYKSDQGLVIITGCGHRGITHIVRHCQNITGIRKIYALIGGFHLRCATPWELLRVRRFINQQQITKLMGCHCTGTWGRWWLPDMISPATGATFVL